ncbi:uncharacterized protein LOC123305865 [Chrysoperla carnea]|uniref:uncharacterized protein LOC123305865 n=1 Tax=Chrysoperla carnea TaxID=189513 RepID=UPI001D06FD8A|nr:uncharacterized protein LOC123305865 [Chrysoperla carnea]
MKSILYTEIILTILGTVITIYECQHLIEKSTSEKENLKTIESIQPKTFPLQNDCDFDCSDDDQTICVKGTDNNYWATFKNRCLYEKGRCSNSELQKSQIMHLGPCKHPSTGKKECPLSCGIEMAPVCVFDKQRKLQKVYPNICYVKKTICENNAELNILNDGYCNTGYKFLRRNY